MQSNLRYQFVGSVAVAALLSACSSIPGPQGESKTTATPLDAEAPAKARQMATVEGITEYQLPNGLRFLLFPDQTKQQITVNITYLVGSRHEGYGETGMAHLLEHLVFKGSTNHPNISDELSERGSSPNGTTWFDRTNYFETFPASEDNLDWALDLEADRMINSFIAKEDLDSEMTVVRNEWERSENNPRSVLTDRVLSAAYLWHNYGNSTIGARSDIENVPIERLRAFYRKYYQPDNAILVVAGRFDPEHAVALVEKKFGSIPRPQRVGANRLFKTYTAEPVQDGERSVTLRRVGDVQVWQAAYHVPAGSDDDFAAIGVLSHLLNARPSGRLYQNLVKPGLAAGANAFALQLGEPGLLLAGVEVRKEDSLIAAEEAALATLHGFAETPPTEEEVNRAKTEFAANFALSFNNPQSIGLQLSEWAAMGDWRLMFLYRDRMEQVTPEDVLAVAKRYLVPSNRTIGYFYPTDATPPRAEIPTPPDVPALVADYRGREAVSQGEAFDPTPANIESRTRRTTLSNGVKVALLPKKNRGAAVSVSMAFRHGTEDALAGKATAASFAGSLLMRGTKNRSRQEIRDEIDRLKIQGSVNGGAISASASALTMRENLPATLRLYAEILREPRFDEAEFELLREERLARLEAQRSNPQSLASTAMNRHFNQSYGEDHVFYVPTLDELIARTEALTLTEVRDFWANFYGAEGGTIAIVGDFDPDAIVPVLEAAFQGWESKQPYARVAAPYMPVPPAAIDIETPDKTNAVMFASQRFGIRDDHDDYPALALANYMLGGGFLNSRLATRIRQREGLSYGVGSSFSAHPIDASARFMAYAIFAPENGDKVVTAFKEEMARALKSGFGEDEVAAAKRGFLDSAQNRRANDGVVAQLLANDLFFDRTMAFVEAQEAAVEALAPEAVRQALNRHIDLAKMSVFRGGDFAGKSEE